MARLVAWRLWRCGGRLGEVEQCAVAAVERGSIAQTAEGEGAVITGAEGVGSSGDAGVDGRRGRLCTGGTGALLCLILVVAAAVRLIGIAQPSFANDEISELRIAHASVSEIVTFGDGFPPLYNLLFHVVVPLGDLAGRVLSALCGVAAAGLTWAWGRRLGGERVGLIAACFMALSPFAVYYSREGRAYALLALLTVASLWSLWIALEESSTFAWVRWGVISALGMYTHYIFGVVIVGGVVVALSEVQRAARGRMWAGFGVLLAAAAPVLVLLPSDMVVQLGYGSGGGIRLDKAVHAGYQLLVGTTLGPAFRDVLGASVIDAVRAAWFWAAVTALPLSVLLVQGYRALSRIARRRLVILAVVGLGLELAVIHATGYGFGALYVSWLLFPLAVWAAAGLAGLGPWCRWALAAVLLAVASSSVVAGWLDPHHHQDDARGVAAYLQSSGAFEQPVIITTEARVRPILYYLDRPLALALPDQWDRDRGRLAYYPEDDLGFVVMPEAVHEGAGIAEALQIIDTSTRPGGSYYLVYTQPFHCDRHGELLTTLTVRDDLILERRFAGMDVYRGVRSS